MGVQVTLSNTVGVITLDRGPVNAFDNAQADAVADAVAQVGADPEVRSVVIRSAHKVFCGGADIAMMDSWLTDPDRGVRMAEFCTRLQDGLATLESLPKPTIAAIDGAATGGGLELALACDFRIARAGARLGLPEVGIGLLPGAGGTQRLTRLVGPAVARRLILGAELIDGTTAATLGVVDHAVDDPEQTAFALAERLGGLPSPAYAAAKRCIAAATGPEDGYALERTEISGLIQTPEAGERLSAFMARSAR
jgi:enoyl-CoA hydratase/carnithine racemase